MTNSAIEIRGVTKSFGSGKKKKNAVIALSLIVNQCSVFGFLGPNGAGKSTTIKMLLNFLPPDSGSLHIHGKKVGVDEFRTDIGYLPEYPFFYHHLTAREALRLSGRLCGMSKTSLENRIELLLDRMNLHGAADQRIAGFSKGMKQRLGMANAMLNDPEVLILDEPMSGLDPVGRHQIKSIIKELREAGKTIFFSSHILSDINELCDTIGILHKGVLLYSGAINSFLRPGENLEERFVTLVQEADNAGVA